ncbi:MAG: DUF2608 domain-containing protein [Alphaproteobacteria bacterium]|nr:DUF2608 domain-containing protein [Alphaproteobacteria bacterium]
MKKNFSKLLSSICLMLLTLCLIACEEKERKEKVENANLVQTVPFKKISSISEVASEIERFVGKNAFNENCWVIFDVDYTLTMPTMAYEGKDYAITQRSLAPILKTITDRVLLDRLCSESVFFPQMLIEKQAPEVITTLKRKGVKVFALTAALGAEKLRKHRFETLNKLGINFRDAFDFSEMPLEDVAPYAEYTAGYSNGVLYANGECNPAGKGKVLQSFMNKINKFPTHVIVIDDNERNLKSLCATLAELKIEFLGLLFTDSNEYEALPADFLNQEVKKMQGNLQL